MPGLTWDGTKCSNINQGECTDLDGYYTIKMNEIDVCIPCPFT
jgi:hypothetical protein